MVYTFVLLKGIRLPIFTNKLGSKTTDFNICLDTGCGLTTFYMDMDTVKIVYPDIRKADTFVTIKTASGTTENNDVYIIPEFKLIDNAGQELSIKNLYCAISEAEFDNIDVLLSGDVFYNTSLTITPHRDDETVKRLIRIDTFDDRRSILVVEPIKNAEGKIVAYPAYLKGVG